MQLISTNTALVRTLERLVHQYSHCSFAVAWASTGTSVYRSVFGNRAKLRQTVIGTHFYQTDPAVLEDFIGSNSVRFLIQPRGVFHPKVFLFWTDDVWEAVIGSANLTGGALTKNAEAVLLVSGNDELTGSLFQDLQALLHSYWTDARSVTEIDAANYRTLWEHHRPTLKKLSAEYGTSRATKSPVESNVMSMDWPRYFDAVKEDTNHGLVDRCELITRIQQEFRTHQTFADMDAEARRMVAGLRSSADPRWAWFGSMTGAGYYYQAINRNDDHVSRALDSIPLEGTVVASDYRSFVREFVKAFPKGGHGVGVASRLLAMKRPDYFVCVDSKNRKLLCKDFGIPQNVDYEQYWTDVIARIVDAAWWNAPRPRRQPAATVWNSRAAMLDAIFYEP